CALPILKHRDAYQAMLGLGAAVSRGGLEPALLELVKIRASQINGCGYCLDMHTKDARANGETEQRLYLLSAWRDANVYSERERAALAWTEAVTRLEGPEAPGELIELAIAQFPVEEPVEIALLIVAI